MTALLLTKAGADHVAPLFVEIAKAMSESGPLVPVRSVVVRHTQIQLPAPSVAIEGSSYASLMVSVVAPPFSGAGSDQVSPLSLETTYTGKAMAAMLHDLRQRSDMTCLYWNTYNSRKLDVGDERPTDLGNIPDEFERYFTSSSASRSNLAQ